ncbi:MAG: radical SAM protein [Dehalococcoidia bacterium]
MRLMLIRPNSPMAVTPPPVGLGYLSHAVKSERGDEVRIIDARRFRLSENTVICQAAEFVPDVIGVTAMTFEAPEATSLISRIKQEWPHIPVMLGGPHPTGFGPELLKKVEADYLVIGEGEDTLVELLGAIESGSEPVNIKGIAWRDENGNVRINGLRGFIEDTERLGIDWASVKPDHYFGLWRRNAMNTVARSPRRLPVFTSRGCPYGCAYCHHIFGRKYRAFDVDRTVLEMIGLRDRYGVREFEIIDDNFNVDLERAKTIMREIIDRKLGCWLTFTNGLRADRMDEELLDLTIRAGTYRIDYAIESASPRIQNLVHKNLDLDRAREVVNMTAARRVVTGTYNMLGFPGETADEMAQTIDFAVSLKNHIASFFYLMPFPGTELAESDPALREKARHLDFGDASGIALNISAVPDEALRKTRQHAYRRFYYSPRRVARILRDVPHNPRLAASALTAFRLSFRENVNY